MGICNSSMPNEPAFDTLFDHMVGDDDRAGEALVVDLDGFEGPLDLLLALARTQKLDLTHMSMLELARQYLRFIDTAEHMRLDVAAEYLVMAAWLAYLKSKLLLPKEAANEDGPSGEELAARLAFRLQRLGAMRDVAARLMNRKQLDRDLFLRGAPEGIRVVRDSAYTASVYDLLKAYADQRKRTATAHVTIKQRQVWSIKEARGRLERLIGRIEDWRTLDTFLLTYLVSPEEARTVLASSLGAILEMAREGEVELRQMQPFAPIYLRKRSVPAGATPVVDAAADPTRGS